MRVFFINFCYRIKMFRTNQLIIIGGPSAVGKSTFINRMKKEKLSPLLNHIPVSKPKDFLSLDAVDLAGIHKSFIDRLILHYDFIYQSSPQERFPYLSNLIKNSNSTHIITLCAESALLSNRISARLERISNIYPPRIKRNEYLHKIKKIYDNQKKLLELFKRWAEYFEEYEIASHIIIDSSRNYCSTWFRDTNEAIHILADILAGQKLTKRCN